LTQRKKKLKKRKRKRKRPRPLTGTECSPKAFAQLM
jgi:hypothetical protein